MKNYTLIAHEDAAELVYNDNDHVTGVCYLPLDSGESIIKSNLSHHFVIFVLRGTISVTCKYYDSEIVEEENMVFIAKGDILEFNAHESDASLLIFGFDEVTIRTSTSLMDFFTMHGNLKEHEHNTLPINEDMKQIVDRIVTQVRKGKMKSAEICLAWNMELFFTFISYYTKTQVTDFFRPLVSTDISFRDFVENNWAEAEGNAEKLIQYSGMKRGIFIKTFKAEFGTTPKEWMNQRFKRRMQHYAALPKMTPLVLAKKLGLTKVRLCQLTRKYFGITPQELIKSRQP